MPHQHHDELTVEAHETEHQEADSIWDYIRLVFHEDIGEGHLEHIVVEQPTDLTPIDFSHDNTYDLISQESRTNLSVRPISLKKYLWARHEDPPRMLYFSSFQHRGPPTLT